MRLQAARSTTPPQRPPSAAPSCAISVATPSFRSKSTETPQGGRGQEGGEKAHQACSVRAVRRLCIQEHLQRIHSSSSCSFTSQSQGSQPGRIPGSWYSWQHGTAARPRPQLCAGRGVLRHGMTQTDFRASAAAHQSRPSAVSCGASPWSFPGHQRLTGSVLSPPTSCAPCSLAHSAASHLLRCGSCSVQRHGMQGAVSEHGSTCGYS